MSLEESLNFLRGSTCIYYAGLDNEGLPFSEGEKQIEFTANDQVLFLKALSLVADYIVIPPSFFFYWSSIHRNSKILETLLHLFQAGIVLSPIYSSMNMGTDFLEHKMWYGSVQDRNLITYNKKLLGPFFRNLPVFHRDVLIQSGGFKHFLASEFSNLESPPPVRKRINGLILDSKSKEVQVSRTQIFRGLNYSLNYEGLKRHQYRKYYYATNRSYYKQGGITYEAAISMVGAERYSVLGKELFSEKQGILIAYDPLVILGIFESMGISKSMINRLSVEGLLDIRGSKIFPVFREAYYSFALTLQKLALSASRISKTLIFNSKSEFTQKFISRYFSEEIHFRKYALRWNLGEMTFFALALGTVGFFVIPIVGAALGAVPIVLYKLNLTPKLSNIVIEKISDKEMPFFLFINELREILQNINKIETNELSKTQPGA